MMAINKWPNLLLISQVKDKNITMYTTNKQSSSIIEQRPDLPFNKPRTKAIHRIGPHHTDVLSIIICGMLGD